jgi:hypothetical protein
MSPFPSWAHAAPVLLLCASNLFMTFAWYGHLKYRSADHAVDLRRIACAARHGLRAIDVINQHGELAAHFRGHALLGDGGGLFHEARVPLFHDFRRDRARERVGRGAFDRGILEAADAIELRLAEPVEQLLELGVGFAGETRR